MHILLAYAEIYTILSHKENLLFLKVEIVQITLPNHIAMTLEIYLTQKFIHRYAHIKIIIIKKKTISLKPKLHSLK